MGEGDGRINRYLDCEGMGKIGRVADGMTDEKEGRHENKSDDWHFDTTVTFTVETHEHIFFLD
jgi:hypothetical protein